MKKIFRVESGLHAGGEYVTNVKTTPDLTKLDHGVNVEAFIRENTIQQYDKTRAYKTGFAVIRQGRILIANMDVPANTEYEPNMWTPLRVDPVWETVTITHDAAGDFLRAGQYIAADSKTNELNFRLPVAPTVGDTITIKDIGEACHISRIRVMSGTYPFLNNSSDLSFSVPGTEMTFVLVQIDGNRWAIHQSTTERTAQTVRFNASTPFQLACGDEIFAETATGHISFQLPAYANNGDTIALYDLDGLNPVNGISLKVHPDALDQSIIQKGVREIESYTTAWDKLIYDATNKVWNIWDGDQKERWSYRADSAILVPHSQNQVIATKDITLTLPRDAGDGDSIIISNLYNTGKNTTVRVTSGSGHKIIGTPDEMNNIQYKDVDKTVSAYSRVDSFTIGSAMKGITFELAFDDTNSTWMFKRFNQRTEAVDPTNRQRYGVAQLATTEEVNLNTAPVDNKIVTPKLLAERIASESLRGIAEIASVAEAKSNTNHTHIVTPKGLYERQATESLRGVAEVASQAEANTDTNDTHIVTPKKLNARRASASMSGVVKLVAEGGAAGVNRDTAGTNVYNWGPAPHKEPQVLTPRLLDQTRATETARGVAYIATQGEANAQGDGARDDVIITPEKLDTRRATVNMPGIAFIATQAEVSAGAAADEQFVTPATLHGIITSETQDGLTRPATDADVNAGTIDNEFISPKKFKNWLSGNRIDVDAASGLNEAGNLWGKMTFSIDVPTETQRGAPRVATQTEANSMISSALDNVFITPKKLNARRATTDLAGIAEIATDTEVKEKTDNSKIVSPYQLSRAVRTYTEYNSSEGNYGTVETATKGEAWAGNTTAGSTTPIDTYKHFPYVITPRTMNYALANYLPKTAKAVDSDKLDGLDSTQFLRSDVDDTLSGHLTHTKTYEQRVRHTDGVDYGVRLTTSGSVGFIQAGSYGSSGQQMRVTGIAGKPLNSFAIQTASLETACIQHDTTTYKIYHEGHKPTPAEVGSYSKSEADSRFVNVSGDSVQGTLKLTKAQTDGCVFSSASMILAPSSTINTSGHTTLAFGVSTTSNYGWSLNAIRTGSDGLSKKFAFRSHNNTGHGIEVFTLSESGVVNTIGDYRVDGKVIIEPDAKINYDKLKGVPTATTGRAGIVQLSNAVDGSSTTLAATENVVRLLQEQINDKAEISGSTMTDLKIRDWIQIGNVIIRPNATTKTLDFVWTDVDP